MKNVVATLKCRKQLCVLLCISLLVAGGNVFFRPKAEIVINNEGPGAPNLVGAASCRSCHEKIYESYMQTAHMNDSRPADAKSIKGSFTHGKNEYSFNPFMSVEMVKSGKRFMQVSKVSGMEVQKEYFDITIGSGRNGQTYLYWKDESLFQLPISYFTGTNSWCNSPGFPNIFYYDRPITLNCLECHASYASAKGIVDNKVVYNKASIVLGIDCERCHGGAADHVVYHQQHPGEKEGKYIVNTKKLERELRVDACALCHSGRREPIQPPFSFRVGDELSKYSKGSPISHQADTLDVHGNQYGLMASSKCYQKSVQMDCSSCHDVHKTEFNEPALYSQRCMNCHGGKEQVHCAYKPSPGQVLENNCIDCHMPKLPSGKIQLNVNGQASPQPDRIRTHFVSIYSTMVGQVKSQKSKVKILRSENFDF